MLKRLRQMRISLAAKCQLLFGAAVLMIITAALLVPWQRMEQLVDQINERSARTVSEWVETDHVARQAAALSAPSAVQSTQVPSATRPATQPAGRNATRPATAPAGGVARDKAVIRMILLSRVGSELPRFERRAAEQFKREPDSDPIARRQDYKDGSITYRFIRPVYATSLCVDCHKRDLTELQQIAPAAASHAPPMLGLISVEIPYQVDANQVFLNRIFLFLAGLLAGTLAIVVFYLITTRLILGPVRVLQETAEKVSQGDLDIRSAIVTGDEFQQLSETFNRMLANLQEGENQLKAINKSLDVKLVQLAESNVALYESNRLKSEFLANVSHELRTPLNSILGFAELLKESATSAEPKTARYLQNIVTSGRNLLELINDLLDLAKIEAGRMEIRSEPFSLTDLLEGLIGIIKPLAEKKELSIALKVDIGVPIFQGDPGKLQQVLYNFLSNAIKFSPDKGRIDVSAELRGEASVRIEVKDQGPGIAPEKHTVIFEKFRQIDGSVTRQHGGSGLGLAISRELTQLLGGTIGVISTPGEGATFWIVIPTNIASHQEAVLVNLASAAEATSAQ